jgi:hypothetical protein
VETTQIESNISLQLILSTRLSTDGNVLPSRIKESEYFGWVLKLEFGYHADFFHYMLDLDYFLLEEDFHPLFYNGKLLQWNICLLYF